MAKVHPKNGCNIRAEISNASECHLPILAIKHQNIKYKTSRLFYSIGLFRSGIVMQTRNINTPWISILSSEYSLTAKK